MGKKRYNWDNLASLWERHGSVSAIAQHLGCSDAGVRRQLKNRKIGPYAVKKKQHKKKRQRVPWYLNRRIPKKFDRTWVHQQYIKNEGDVEPIAKKLGCSKLTVVKLMRREKLGPFRE